jgi:DNA invertase Pin-like site-specific DNA recombinase
VTRVALVLRVSTQEQADSRLGLESQESLCRDAIRGEIEEASVTAYVDEGVSGSIPLALRPRGRELVAAIENRAFDVVVALTQDRLFRSMLDALGTLERWRELKVRLFLVDGGWVDVGDDDAWTQFVIRALFAEMELRRGKKRTKRALKALRDRGVKLGAPPLGFRSAAYMDGTVKVNAGARVVVPEEQAVIDRILAMRAGRKKVPYRTIAALLNEEGAPTRRGGKWHPQTVKLIAERGAV